MLRARASNYTRLTVEETRAIIGDVFSGYYRTTSNTFVSCTFSYDRSGTIAPYDDNSGLALSGVPCLRYNAQIGSDRTGEFIADLNADFGNCDGLYFYALPWINLDRINNVYYSAFAPSAFGLWSLGGVQQTPQVPFLASVDNSDYPARMRLGDAFGTAGTAAFCLEYSGTAGNITVDSVQWALGYEENGMTSLFIPCPVVSRSSGGSGGSGSGGSAVVTGAVSGTYGSGSVDLDVNVNVDQTYPDWMYSADATDVTGDIVSDVTTMFGTVPASALASDVSALGDYDSGIIWYALGELFGRHTEIIMLLSGCGALCIFGFVLNRFGR